MIKSCILFLSLFFIIAFSIQAADTVYINKDTTLKANYYPNNRLFIKVTNATVTYEGRMTVTGGNSRLEVMLNKGKWVFTEASRIYNNQWDGVNARPVFVSGSGITDSVIFEEGFITDHTGWDPAYDFNNQPNWTNNGFSVLYVKNVTCIHEHTQNQPTISKKTYYNTYTHHGVMAINSKGLPNQTKWVINKNDQYTNCQTTWASPFILETNKDLHFEAYWHLGSDVFFGSYDNVPLTKTGKGMLTIQGDQDYEDSTVIDIQEGSVKFMTNPGYYKNYSTIQKHLILEVANEGTLHFENTNADLKRLISNGNVKLEGGLCNIAEQMQLSTESVLEIHNPDDNKYQINTNGAITLSGILKIYGLNLNESVKICESATGISGTFSQTNGFNVIYEDKKVYATKITVENDMIEQSAFSAEIRYKAGEPILKIAAENEVLTIEIFDINGLKLYNQQVSAYENINLDLKQNITNYSGKVVLIKIRSNSNAQTLKAIL